MTRLSEAYDLPYHPDKIAELFVEAWNRRDAHFLASLFDEDADFINVTGLWWHRRAAIEKAHAYGLSTIFNHSSLKLIRSKVRFLSAGIAVVHAKIRLSGQTAVAQVAKPSLRKTIFTFVCRREGDLWSVVSAQNTDIIPNTETHVRDEKGQLIPVNYREKD